MKIITQILVFILLSISNHSQTSINDFTAIEFSSQDNGGIISTFIKSNNTLIWKQDNNSSIQEVTLSIHNISGTWNHDTSTGNVTISASLNEHQVTLSLTGSSTAINATLSMTNEQSTSPQVLDYNINSINYNQ